MSVESTSEKAPSYNSPMHTEWDVVEKDSHYYSCSTHASATPVLQAQFQRPQAKNALQVLSMTLVDMAEGRGCDKCMMKEAARTITTCVRELRAAKKNGEWSKEEKKAMKNEAKAIFGEIKREVKTTWKNKD